MLDWSILHCSQSRSTPSPWQADQRGNTMSTIASPFRSANKKRPPPLVEQTFRLLVVRVPFLSPVLEVATSFPQSDPRGIPQFFVGWEHPVRNQAADRKRRAELEREKSAISAGCGVPWRRVWNYPLEGVLLVAVLAGVSNNGWTLICDDCAKGFGYLDCVFARHVGRNGAGCGSEENANLLAKTQCCEDDAAASLNEWRGG